MNAQNPFDATCLTAALEYAARGWHVFPATVDSTGAKKGCVAGEHGNGRRWGNTTDPALIREYWRRFPEAMVGIACGPDTGLFVVECDTPEGHDVDGIRSMIDLLTEFGALPETIEALSPSGSWHQFFRWPEDVVIANSTSLVAPGIDVRGDGGMVIAAPSLKPGNPKPYHWKNPPGPFGLGDCPDWLLKRCLKPMAQGAKQGFRIDTGNHRSGDDKAGAAEVAVLLSHIDPDTGGYHRWCDVLMALHDHFGGNGVGLALAEDWSSRGGKFKTGEVAVKWRGFTAGGGKTIATVAELARQNGADLSEIARRHKASRARPARGPEATTSDSSVADHKVPDAFDLSHDTLAREIGRRGWDLDARHVASQNRWYLWDGTCWPADDRLQHVSLCRDFLNQRAAEVLGAVERKAEGMEGKAGERLQAWAMGEARILRSASTVAAVVGLARSNRASVAGAEDFDGDLMLLGTPGGTVDLRNGDLRAARREDMITRLTAVSPTLRGVPALRWQRFLEEVFEGDVELIAFMQRTAGYALTGMTTEHKLLFLYGTGRNGKSTFLEVLSWLWGGYARRAPAAAFLSSQVERHSTDIAGLNGARLVVGSELPKGKTWDESVIKDLTGGDTMSARLMRQDNVDFKPQLTLMIAGNTMPSFRGVDEALRARVVLVPFTVTIPAEKRDKDLPDKLRAEGPAILRWAIDGALEWQRRGLDVPASVAAASAEYLDGEDTLGQFLLDETDRDPAAFTTTADLHMRFRQWTEVQGLGPWTSHTFTKELKSRGFQEARRNYGRGFQGVKLR